MIKTGAEWVKSGCLVEGETLVCADSDYGLTKQGVEYKVRKNLEGVWVFSDLGHYVESYNVSLFERKNKSMCLTGRCSSCQRESDSKVDWSKPLFSEPFCREGVDLIYLGYSKFSHNTVVLEGSNGRLWLANEKTGEILDSRWTRSVRNIDEDELAWWKFKVGVVEVDDRLTTLEEAFRAGRASK